MTEEALWNFALARYQRAGVAERCLRLQDKAGADVNMLLTAAWLAEQRRCWQREQVRDLIARCASWREHCVLPLRTVRRYLKDQGEISALYAQAKALELDAEIHQLHRLHNALQAMRLKPLATSKTEALTANLQTYFDCIDSAQPIADADRLALIEALAQ